MKNLDCVLVHVPKYQNYYPPLNNYSSLNWMSQSIFGLADALKKSGLAGKIIHPGVESILDKRFSLRNYLQQNNARSVGFSLHFHQQISDTLAAVQQLKKELPDIFVFLGGMTASFFSRELMQYPEVDAVIRGEGEIPLPALVQKIEQGKELFDEVPNLTWRRGNEIVENPMNFVAAEGVLDKLDYAHLPYLEHYEKYLNFPKAVFHTKLSPTWNYKLSQKLYAERKNIFGGLTIGRGCHVNCFYCGGGSRAQALINRRKKVIFRSPDKVVESMQHLQSFGYSGTFISFDPHPQSQHYYVDLFQKMRQAKLNFDVIFSAWHLPSKEFLLEFQKTFSRGSSISISPETGSERLRKTARGNFFRNTELMEMLDQCEKLNIRTTVFFSLGIPGENKDDFLETLTMKDMIRSRYKNIGTRAFLIEMEPGAPWHLHPEKFGLKKIRRSLQDFIEEQSMPGYSSMTSVGFMKDELFDEKLKDRQDLEKRLLKLKCDNFCPNRKICAVMKTGWKAAGWVGMIN
ncbi:MAG: radical SAM protein [Actinobacteria bacterium]|nr:radical SAM protein [Actinomycetota bacterium]